MPTPQHCLGLSELRKATFLLLRILKPSFGEKPQFHGFHVSRRPDRAPPTLGESGTWRRAARPEGRVTVKAASLGVRGAALSSSWSVSPCPWGRGCSQMSTVAGKDTSHGQTPHANASPNKTAGSGDGRAHGQPTRVRVTGTAVRPSSHQLPCGAGTRGQSPSYNLA